MKPFELCGPLPEGTTVLEASAGTGKTFTIAALTARYVAEQDADLAGLMLVTFGNAASRELRDRVRERLVFSESGLREPARARAHEDGVLRHLASASDDEVEARRKRLARAVAGFDAATITTVHSFCSQMLTGLGIVADRDPSAELTEVLDDLVQEVVDDLYLRKYAKADGARPEVTHEGLLELGMSAVRHRGAILSPADAPGVPGLHARAAKSICEEVERRKRQRGLVDYDDWLVLLRNALADPVQGEVAQQRVRSGYRAVLVDEFQDTDSVQWEVLQRAFDGHAALVLIGDPKQAIYAFRGGDVATYLAAARRATTRATLTRNWRSDAPLLAAIEQIFGNAPLGSPDIVVRPVESQHQQRRLTGAGAPLRLRRIPRSGTRFPAVDLVREQVAEDVAADLVRLLSGPARFCERPVVPGDIAVLVRTNKQGAMVHAALSRAGVPAVLAGGGSVFTTSGAKEWLVLLEAMEQPHRAGRVRAAALSVFLGGSWASLDAAGDDLTDRLGSRLRRWSDLLAVRGVAAFFEVLTAEEQLPARVLAQPDGERLLTDLRHVAQALHAAARAESLGLTALVAWLRRRMSLAAQENTDDRTRRLESDAAAVQILTVHVSKGLEFPVVYVPYAWDRWANDRPARLHFHDRDGKRVLDVGGPDGPSYAEYRARSEAEDAGEELRLLYVAMTRAKSQVVAWWAATRHNTGTAPLHRLLFSAAGVGELPAYIAPPADAEAVRRLDEVAAASGGRITAEVVTPGPTVPWAPPPSDPPPLSSGEFQRSLDMAWRRTSYSALTAEAHDPPPGVGSEPDAPGTTDEPGGAVDVLEEPPPDSPISAMTDLPGGTAFGTLVHEVLEDLDPAALGQRCADAVALRPGSGLDPRALADGLRPALHTPLGDLGMTLADFGPGDRLAELAFELPLSGGDRPRAHATLREVAAMLRRYDLGPVADYPQLLDSLTPAAFRGFLSGSIDAVLRMPGPTYLVVDHKTNRLGGHPLTAWHYRPAALAAEMMRTHYVLQSLLYSVATHRFLRWRQRNYDPARHLGGIVYTFVRGMCGPASPPGAGVFVWQPPAELVVELSDLLAGRS